tara:strand:+ start:2754 stop:3311 length:558 start_codon:yes stop_codon:yes gene_type:complete
MKNLTLTLFCCAIALISTSCSVVAVRGTVGDPLSDEETSEFLGEWVTAQGDPFTVTLVPDTPNLLLTSVSDSGKKEEMKGTVTKLGDDCVVIWGTIEEKGFYAPMKVVDADGAIVLFCPDLDEVKRLVSDGEIKAATHDLDKGSYLLEADGIEGLLTSKTFWSLDDAVPFLKKDSEVESGPVEKF